MKILKNTLKNGAIRNIIFQDKKDKEWYAVALELNIVVSGESPIVAQSNLQEAVIGYIESLTKIKGFRNTAVESTLNQKSISEYEDIWNSLESKSNQKSKVFNNKIISSWGNILLPNYA